jgi:hypothetical protein
VERGCGQHQSRDHADGDAADRFRNPLQFAVVNRVVNRVFDRWWGLELHDGRYDADCSAEMVATASTLSSAGSHDLLNSTPQKSSKVS